MSCPPDPTKKVGSIQLKIHLCAARELYDKMKRSAQLLILKKEVNCFAIFRIILTLKIPDSTEKARTDIYYQKCIPPLHCTG